MQQSHYGLKHCTPNVFKISLRKLFLLSSSIFFSLFWVNAQSDYNIQLALSSVDCNNNTVCYDVQLRSSSGTWDLAGQNYRLYY